MKDKELDDYVLFLLGLDVEIFKSEVGKAFRKPEIFMPLASYAGLYAKEFTAFIDSIVGPREEPKVVPPPVIVRMNPVIYDEIKKR